MTFLKVSNIGKQSDANVILVNISFNQRKLQRLVIAGETGSGKSTLLKMLAGLDQPDAGSIYFEDGRVEGSQEKLVPGHESISYLSQYFELPKFLRVEQILTYSNHLSSSAAESIYEVCRITHLLKRKTDQLSGGERQRIGMARALIGSPKLLLLDEPYSNLDTIHKNILKNVIHDIGDKLKITCILVSHDPTDTLSWADEIIVLKEGSIIQKGSPQAIYAKPKNEYVAGLFGKYNVINPHSAVGKMLLLGGTKKLFTRCEQISIVKKGLRRLKGIIRNVIFFGGFIEIEVEVQTEIVLVRTIHFNLEIGKIVYLEISMDNAWFIK